MAKQGEINYWRRLDEAGRHFTVNKPFADPNCAGHLLQLGAILSLLPPPPARLLDVGCGTGWTSRLFARHGYEVVAVDIAPDMIDQARRGPVPDNLHFRVADYEALDFAAVFDAAVCYDALHHAVDEVQALRAIYRALRPGGVCVTAEPGAGHAETPASREAVRRFQVTERDMPPAVIVAAARQAGFRHCRTYPHAFDVGNVLYRRPAGRWGWLHRLRAWWRLGRLLRQQDRRGGIVVLTRDD